MSFARKILRAQLHARRDASPSVHEMLARLEREIGAADVPLDAAIIVGSGGRLRGWLPAASDVVVEARS